MKTYQLLIIAWMLVSKAIFGNNGLNPEKILKATRVEEEIKIDGILSEASWHTAGKAFGFIQSEPLVGKPASFDTETYFLYDNNAIFIGARMHDPHSEKILKELSLRDQIGNADNFKVFFDTYKSGLNGFKFSVTASGVQYESIVSNHEDDTKWNAVWQSKVTIDSGGWNVEIRIPYSSLRFPTSEIQDWKVQFSREIRRLRETSNWSPIDPLINGWVQQSGTVTHLENIKTPVRLSLTPYVSAYVNTSFDPNSSTNKFSSGTAYSAGLDLKYGLSDAYTFDMTLVPDFGQVISDKQVLNLSPFEVFFEENRQFFTEGTELFNRGRLFYSRRVGGLPLHYAEVSNQLLDGEKILKNPEVTQLYNATKISGRNTRGTGIGLFNAIVGESFAIIKTEDGIERTVRTNPISNYNAFVIDQNLRNNSSISFMNTNVLRNGSDYDANVTASFFNFKTKSQQFGLSGNAVLTQKIYTKTTDIGHSYNISLGKISGNWIYKVNHGVKSDNYDPNDLGFLYSPNEKFVGLESGYTQYKPNNQALQQYRINGSTVYSLLYKPNAFTEYAINLSSFILWKSRFAIGLNSLLAPVEAYDYFEPRTKDYSKFLAIPINYQAGGFVSSDYRKSFAYDINISYRYFNAELRKSFVLGINPRIRFNDKFSIFTSTSLTKLFAEPGYVNKNLSTGPISGIQTNDILMGVRNRLIIENSISGKFTFSSVMNVNIRIRHYWDKVRYQSFGRLNELGYLDLLSYNGTDSNGVAVYDRNVNIFNIDLQYNWRFAPGSDVIFVWKSQILNADKKYERDYLSNLTGLFDSPQSNNFSVRFLYFLDYLYLFPRKNV